MIWPFNAMFSGVDLDGADAFGVFGGVDVEVHLGAAFEDDAAVGGVEDDAAEEGEDVGADDAIGAAAVGEFRGGVHEEDGEFLHLGVADEAERYDDGLDVEEAADAVGGGGKQLERAFTVGVGDVGFLDEAGVEHDGGIAAGVEVEDGVALVGETGGEDDGDGQGVGAVGEIEDFAGAGVMVAAVGIEGDEAVGKVNLDDELAEERQAEDAVEVMGVEEFEIVEVDEGHGVGDGDGAELSIEVVSRGDANFATAVADAALLDEGDVTDANLLGGGAVEDVDAGAGVKEKDHAGMVVDGEGEEDVVLGVFKGHGEAAVEARLGEERGPGPG